MSSNVSDSPTRVAVRAGNRIPRSIYTYVLDFTPHIPSICIACAHPVLRYSREAVAAVRVQHEEKRRGDLYLCRVEGERDSRDRRKLSLDFDHGDGGVGGRTPHENVLSGRWRQREYHRLEGVLEQIVSDLVLSGWWISRRLPGHSSLNGSVSASFYSLGDEEQEAAMLDQRRRVRALTDDDSGPWCVSEEVVPLEVDIKRVENAEDAERTACSVAALLNALASPPFQEVRGSVIVSCLRSLILTPRSLVLTDETGCLPLLHSLPLLTKLESFASSFGSLGPQALSCLSVLKIRNASIESLDCLRGQRHLQLLDISRCKNLQDVSAVSNLLNLMELSISNSRQLSMQCEFHKCKQLTTVSLLWCPSICDVACVLAAPRLSTLNLSYSHVEDIASLLQDRECRGPGLCTLLLRGCPDAAVLLSALPDPDHEAKTQNPTSGAADRRKEKRLTAPPKVLSLLENVDLALSETVDDHLLKLLGWCCPNLRQVNVRECPMVRSLSSLRCVASSLEAVDASYTQVSDINGLVECKALRTIRLRDCFRLKNLTALTKVVDTLEEVDATMSTKVNAWNRGTQSERDAYVENLFSPMLLMRPATTATSRSGPDAPFAAFFEGNADGQEERAAAPALTAQNARAAAERADLLALLKRPLQPSVEPPAQRQLQAGGIW